MTARLDSPKRFIAVDGAGGIRTLEGEARRLHGSMEKPLHSLGALFQRLLSSSDDAPGS